MHEIKRIGVLQAAKFMAVVYLALSLLFTIFPGGCRSKAAFRLAGYCFRSF